MNISIISVGKLKERYLKQAIEEYSKRLTSYTKLTLTEVPDEKAPEHLSNAQVEYVKRTEGNRILAKIPNTAYVIALAIEGKNPTSEQFAANLDKLATNGHSRLVFVIGGSLGLSAEVMKRANASLSFSNMTFPHQLMRVILLEQIYRGFRIMRGEPYHK